jgi:hypothetical protein
MYLTLDRERLSYAVSFVARADGLLGPMKNAADQRRWVMGFPALHFVGLLSCLSSVACTPTLANRVPGSKIVMSRMVIRPAFTTSHELDASDKSESDTEHATELFNAINSQTVRILPPHPTSRARHPV